MTPLRCCVIDDEPLAGNLIGSYVSRTPVLKLDGVFTSAQEAYARIASGEIDLIFLDIQMPQISGMEFVKLIPARVRVVFVTAYDNYAIEGLRAHAADYLLKPVSYQEFLASVNRVIEMDSVAAENSSAQAADASRAVRDADTEYLIVKSEYRLRQILKADILYVEGLKDYVRIFIEGETKSVMTLLSMKALELSLPHAQFMRVHRSYIINLNKINTIERNKLVITDRRLNPAVNHEVPVSDSYRPALLNFVSTRLPQQE